MSDYPSSEQHELMLDGTISNPRYPSDIHASVDVPDSTLAKAIPRKRCHHRETIINVYKPRTPAVPTSGGYSVDMHRVLKGLEQCRDQKYRMKRLP